MHHIILGNIITVIDACLAPQNEKFHKKSADRHVAAEKLGKVLFPKRPFFRMINYALYSGAEVLYVQEVLSIII